MTFLAILIGLYGGLFFLLGFRIGIWTTARNQVGKRQPSRASGKLSVQYRGPDHVGPAEFPYWDGDRK
jgi:hypothetical protein